MNFLSIMLFAIGMSLDDFALALSLSLLLKVSKIQERIRYACKLAIAFSISTTLLPFLGWLIGFGIYKLVVSVAPWIILGVFCGVGLWMIKEGFEKDNKGLEKKNIGSFWILVVIGILGSIDEGVAGIGLAFLDTSIFITVIAIIILNVIFVIIATLISNYIPTIYHKIIKILAGVLLIVLGIINCIESLM